jgi:hypothetical protein
MKCRRGTLRILRFTVLLNCGFFAFAADPQLPRPVAILDTGELLPESQRDPAFTTVAFSSDTTIEVVACATVRRDASCPFSVFRWESGRLSHIPEAPLLEIGENTSADKRRELLDFNDRKVSRFQHLLDSIRTVTTLGMIAPEGVNREVVQVIDAVTRRSCFYWRGTFPATYHRRRSAGISASGEFVAIKVGNALSVYRLPSVCEGRKVTRRGM